MSKKKSLALVAVNLLAGYFLTNGVKLLSYLAVALISFLAGMHIWVVLELL